MSPGSVETVLGFRVKSGWATAVLVRGPASAPEVLDRSRVELSDPAVPATRQPHHAGMGVAQRDSAKVARLTETIRRCAERSIAELVQRHRRAGHHLSRAAIVVGSETDPARITNPHIQAHAYEGQLFRQVVEEAGRSCQIQSVTFVERGLLERAGETLRTPAAELKRALTQLGRGVGGPWRAEEKVAALAAWILLASPAVRAG